MLSAPELILIGAIALMVFGPKRLPEVARGLGKGIRDFKKAMSEDDEKEIQSQDRLASKSLTVSSYENSESKSN